MADSSTVIYGVAILAMAASSATCAGVVPVVYRWLRDRHLQPWVNHIDLRLQSLFLFTSLKRWLPGYVLMLIVLPTACLLWSRSVLMAGILTVLLISAPGVLIAALVRRRQREITQDLPDALSQIASAMRAGSTFNTAIQSIVSEHRGALAQELSMFLREQRMGSPVAEALQHLARRVDTEEIELFVAATVVARSVGGNLAEILQGLAESLREKIELEARIRTLTAQGVLQGRVVSLLPVLVLAALLFLEPQATWPIFTSLLGWCFLAVILCLLTAGGLMIHRIVTIKV